MRIRLYNAKILTMHDEDILKGELWIKDDLVEYIGKPCNIQGKFDREIDMQENLVMPGFKNAHSHSAMTFARTYGDGLPLEKWLKEKIFPMEAKLTPQHIYYYTKLAYMEYLSSGITAAFDMYYEPEAIIKASREVGFRTVLCGAINNFKESVDILEGYYNQYNKEKNLISYILGFHAEYTTDLSIIEKVGKLAEKYKAPVYVHNSETRKEVDDCIKRYGMTPTELFVKTGVYEYGGGGFHCIYLNDRDLDIFKEKKLNAILCVCSNLKLASGVVEAEKYRKKGINLALGTDGASSNNGLDMFREMYIVTMLQKVVENNASALPAYETLKMATVNSAKAIGLSECDVLQVGKKADLIAIDLHAPNMQPENDIIKNLVYSGGKQNVYMTMVDGKILYEKGEYKTVDVEETYFYANKLLQTLY